MKRIKLLILLLLSLTALQAQFKFPEYIEHDNYDNALVDYHQLRGGVWYVDDITARDTIPLDKRAKGMIVTVGSDSYIYSNASVLDIDWTSLSNWADLGGEGITLPVDSLAFIKQTPSYYQGKIIYDTVSNPLGVFTSYNKEADVSLQNGFELFIPTAWNETGATILNGTVIFIDSAYLGRPSVGLADNRYYNSSRAIAIATHDVENNSWGMFTYFGLLRGIDLTAFHVNDILYLDTAGLMTNVKPIGGAWVIELGTVLDNSSNGVMNVRINISTYTDELIKSFGFPYYDKTQFTISMNDANRYVRLTEVGDGFYYYQNGTKYIRHDDSLQIADIEGTHAIYYNGETLSEIANPTTSQIVSLLMDYNLAAYIYWNATDNKTEYLGNERHTFQMNKATHIWAHLSFGTRYGGGLALADITAEGDGDVDSTAQFTVQSGFVMDEDIFHNSPNLPRGSTIPICWFSGAGLDLRRTYEPGFAVLSDITAGVGVTGRLVYNDVTTGILATVPSGDFVFYHIFATNEETDTLKIISVPGQTFYGNVSAARAAEVTDYQNMILTGLNIAEYKHIASVIYGTNNTFDNGVRARIRLTNDGFDYLDYRAESDAASGGGGTSSSFLDLTDTPLSYAGEGEKVLAVNSAETGVEFIDINTDSTWQSITSTEEINIGSNRFSIDTDTTVFSGNFRIDPPGDGYFLFKDPYKLEFHNPDSNIFIGSRLTAMTLTTGLKNTGVGFNTFLRLTTGSWNTTIGRRSMRFLTEGEYNSNFGAEGQYLMGNASRNTSGGFRALYLNEIGDGLTALGYFAGYNCKGSRSLFLGHRAGEFELGGDLFYLDNSSTSDPLLKGYFALDSLIVNRRLFVREILHTPQIMVDTITVKDVLRIEGGIDVVANTGTFASVDTVSFLNQHVVNLTVTGDSDILILDVAEGSNPILRIIQDGVHTVTLSGVTATPDAATKSIATASGSITRLQFDNINGTIYYDLSIANE